MKRIIQKFRSEKSEDLTWVVNAMLVAMGLIVVALVLFLTFL